MLSRRLIACLDVQGGRVVKGRRFVDLRDVGEPATLASLYESEGADEIVFLDILASADARTTLLDEVRRTAASLFVPLTVGGGIGSLSEVHAALRAGADKVSINSAAVRRPELLTDAARAFGSQCVVASIDAARTPTGWAVFVKGGRELAGLDAVAWARECEGRGAGEILLTSIDRDGARTGYDLALTSAVVGTVSVPVVASGGAGSAVDVCRVLETGVQAALVAGILHDGITTIGGIKRAMQERGFPTRRVAA
jgi:cyclase